MGIIGYSFGGFSELVNDFILRTPAQRTLGWVTLILFFGVPLLALVTLMVRRVLRIRGGGRYFALGYGILWATGAVCVVFLAASVTREFSHRETVEQDMPVAQPHNGRLILTVPGRPVMYSNSLPWLHGHILGWDVDNGQMQSARVLVHTALSPDSLYHVILKRSSLGVNAAQATARAERIAYSLHTISDSVLTLDNGYLITKSDGYRGQNVVVEVQVPAGKQIRFDRSVDEKLVAFQQSVSQSYGYANGSWGIHYNNTIDLQDWEPDIDYVMNAAGELTDPLHPDEEDLNKTGSNRIAQRAADRKIDSLDRLMDAIDRQKDALENAQDD